MNKKKTKITRDIKLSSLDETYYEILKSLIWKYWWKKSLFQIFNSLKLKLKFQKDKFYEKKKSRK